MPVCVTTKIIQTSTGEELVYVPSSGTCTYELVTQSELALNDVSPADIKAAFEFSFTLILFCFFFSRVIGAIANLVRVG